MIRATGNDWRLWAILLAPTLVGCRGPHGPPQDPLFLAKQPVESQAIAAPAEVLAFSEPSLPRDPFPAKSATALARHSNRRSQARPLPTEPRESMSLFNSAQPPRAIPGVLTHRPAAPALEPVAPNKP